ncbi:alpha-amylase family glycosyl hydrolase [Sporosarcina trichiuri]|uniref:alpha-amylase family glycosyl hydrolase n=1 Tax=Sporosarcina trichiuri TaxID=3056445 RepID=UPI0025B480FA|nr:alpha-amylase family glycosyl hydrolase [Sporosarcina sp. 0.2-SM1T-5]WJY26062.1 alpha-amylase family glycosyl hydrolase [Sporosarcina sp. 0.2-SM1T-5]
MKAKRLISVLMLIPLLFAAAWPASASAKNERTITDESIYDLLVDRFNNGDGRNDGNADAQDPEAFNGGDFVGISLRLQHILDMGFTAVSIGPVFKTASYDGSEVLDYTKLEDHFGTEEDFKDMLDELHDKDIRVIADFPLAGVSKDHVWKDKLPWTAGDGATIDWNADDADVQRVLREAMTDFVKKYDLDGIRLTKTDQYDPAVLDGFIEALKKASPDLYVLSGEETEAAVDAQPNDSEMEALRQTFVKVSPDSKPMDQFSADGRGDLIQFDKLTGPRFTHAIVEERMFPPTRWKVAVTALFTLPGIPVMPYGTEIAVNGQKAPESHPLFNFKTDMELKDLIGNLNQLRNESKTLRTGDFKMLHNKDGYLVYKIWDDEETWIAAVNNTDKTQTYELDPSEIGSKKRLRGLLDSDQIVETEDGKYHVVMDRELAELYLVKEDKGFNIPYLIASIMVYVLFLGFLWAVWRKGRAARKARSVK